MLEDDALLLGPDRPAGRIVRRVEVEHARAGSQCRHQLGEIERPAAGREIERDCCDARAEDLRDFLKVGPERHHFDHVVAGIDQELGSEHQRVDPGARNRDLPGIGLAVQARDVGRERFTQPGDAEVVRIEELAGRDRLGRRPPDELRRRLVGLADPKREHVLAAEALVVELADLGGGERLDRGARTQRGKRWCFEFHGGERGYSGPAGRV